MKTIVIYYLEQAKFYMKNGVYPIRNIYSEKYDKVVFVFNLDETKEVWEGWKNLCHKF